MRTASVVVVLVCATMLLCGGVARADNYIKVIPGTNVEYGSVSSSGISWIASGNVLTSSASGNKVKVADFDDDGYDEILLITSGSEYYVKPSVSGMTLTGTQSTLSSFVSTTASGYSVGKFLAGDSRDYMLTHALGTGKEELNMVGASGATFLGWGNIDYATTSGSVSYLVGDYDNNNVDDVYVIHSGTDFVITSITPHADQTLTSTDYAVTGLGAPSTTFSYVSGYFLENSSRDQVLRIVSSGSEYTNLYGLNDGSSWGLSQLGAFATNPFTLTSTDNLVVGDFDLDGLDELFVIRDSNELYYDNFSITGGVLTADEYSFSGAGTGFNFAGEFVPEPATMTVLLLGGLLPMFRRRR